VNIFVYRKNGNRKCRYAVHCEAPPMAQKYWFTLPNESFTLELPNRVVRAIIEKNEVEVWWVTDFEERYVTIIKNKIKRTL